MNGSKTRMIESVKKDINWFLLFVKHFSGTTNYMHKNLYCSDVIELDVCLTGLGGRFNQFVKIYQFKDSIIPSMFTIVHMEMWNVLLALRLWGHMWKRKQIVVKCDNQAVVSVINTGVIRDNGLGPLFEIFGLKLLCGILN